VDESQKKRTKQEFLDDQMRFLEKVNKKTEDMRNQTSQMEMSKQNPSIDETSRRIIEEKMADRKDQATHVRLYNL
jgi:predicted transcriptional regulator